MPQTWRTKIKQLTPSNYCTLKFLQKEERTHKKQKVSEDSCRRVGKADTQAKNRKTKKQSFCGHVFKYVRDWNSTHKKFEIVTTDYGQIVAKDKNTDTWYRISSTEDFHDAGIDFDEEEFDELF